MLSTKLPLPLDRMVCEAFAFVLLRVFLSFSNPSAATSGFIVGWLLAAILLIPFQGVPRSTLDFRGATTCPSPSFHWWLVFSALHLTPSAVTIHVRSPFGALVSLVHGILPPFVLSLPTCLRTFDSGFSWDGLIVFFPQ